MGGMERDAILAQNPMSPAPQEVIDALEIVFVTYYGFDDAVHIGHIVVHKDVASEVKRFFETALALKFPIQQVIPISDEKYQWNDEASCNDNNSSGYNYRRIAGTETISKHASGMAFDINPAQNVYIKYDKDGKELCRFPKDTVYDEHAKGTLTNTHPLVEIMKNLGWAWGGDWKAESGRVDYQHFEKTV